MAGKCNETLISNLAAGLNPEVALAACRVLEASERMQTSITASLAALDRLIAHSKRVQAEIEAISRLNRVVERDREFETGELTPLEKEN